MGGTAVLTAAPARQAEIDLAAAAINGMEAQFTHSFTPKGFNNPQVESGSVIFGKLPAMRWTYARPESKTFVFDGSRSWFYVPADKQVTIADIDDQRKREICRSFWSVTRRPVIATSASANSGGETP